MKPMPGNTAHIEMVPMIEGKPYRPFVFEHEPLQSAVLIMLHPIKTQNFIENEAQQFEILFTKRSSNLISHRGQISFPGGRRENNESPTETALRETEEEVGIRYDKIEIIGQLTTLYVPPSNSLIIPIVSLLNEKLPLKINLAEVEEAFWVKLNEFMDEDKINREKWNIRGTLVDVPFWPIHPTTPLWGATAMILMELVHLYREYRAE